MFIIPFYILNKVKEIIIDHECSIGNITKVLYIIDNVPIYMHRGCGPKIRYDYWLL